MLVTLARSRIPIVSDAAVRSIEKTSDRLIKDGFYREAEEAWWQMDPRTSRKARDKLIRLWSRQGLYGPNETRFMKQFLPLGVRLSSAVRAYQVFEFLNLFGDTEAEELKQNVETHLLKPRRWDMRSLMVATNLLLGHDPNHPLGLKLLKERLRAKDLVRSPFLSHMGVSKGLRDEPSVKDAADVYVALQKGQREIYETLFDPKHSLAIVGNSPRETGLGRGEEIDSHDVVVRFNHVEVPEHFQADYGRKVSVSVLNSTTILKAPEKLIEVDGFIISGLEVETRFPQTTLIGDIFKAGRPIGTVPFNDLQRLTYALGAPPSSGLQIIQSALRTRGPGAPVSYFGFGFIDQLDQENELPENPAASKLSLKHNWLGELPLFKYLISADSLEEDLPLYQRNVERTELAKKF